MRQGLILIPFIAACAGTAAGAQLSATLDPDELIAQLRPAYSRPGTFFPASLRFPLRLDSLADLKAARAEAEQRPDDLEARRRLAQLTEQAEDPTAEGRWREVLELVELQLKKKPTDPTLLERQVEAMVGADLAIRVVPPAEKLWAAAPKSWRVQLLYGDARLRRADFNWRVCVRLGERARTVPQFAELVGDLAAAGTAYQEAIALAPAEAAPRGARISLAMARMVMENLLPKGSLPSTGGLDVAALRAELFGLCRSNPGRVEPLWHTAHFLATFGTQDPPLPAVERAFMQQALDDAQATDPAGRTFLAEARGMWAVAGQDWAGSRKAFAAAREAHPARRFVATWTALSDARCGEPAGVVTERVRARLERTESPEDFVLLGLLLGSDDPAAAVQALRKAIELDVNNANARFNLALLLLRRRTDSTEARHHLREAIELEPDNLEARLTHGVALALDGNTKAARQYLQELKEQPHVDASLKKRVSVLLGLMERAAR